MTAPASTTSTADVLLATATFQAAAAFYRVAEQGVEAAAFTLLAGRLRGVWPNAVAYRLEGHINEDGEKVLRITEVWLDVDAGRFDRLSVEDGNVDVDDFDDDQGEVLLYLAAVTGDEYLSDESSDLNGEVIGLDDFDTARLDG